MKKFLLVLTIILGIAFVGCKQKEESQATKTYVIGTNAEYPPYEYLESDKIVGFDADIIQELSKRLGFEYKWSNMNFDGLIGALQSKKVDMVIAGMTITKEREKFVSFSTPYIFPKVCYVILKTSPIKTVEDLENKKFGVELGTTEEQIALQTPGAQVIPFSGHTAALLALKAEKTDVMLLDSSVAQKYLENNPELKILGVAKGEDKAMAFNKENTALREEVDKELKKMIEDGTINKLKEKYGI